MSSTGRFAAAGAQGAREWDRARVDVRFQDFLYQSFPGQAGDAVIPAQVLPEWYRTIPAALPVQLFAYAAARVRNLEPGVMRYLGWVVTGDHQRPPIS